MSRCSKDVLKLFKLVLGGCWRARADSLLTLSATIMDSVAVLELACMLVRERDLRCLLEPRLPTGGSREASLTGGLNER